MGTAVHAQEHSPAVQKLGFGESGWSQKSSIVTGKAVRCFQAGTQHLASDCRRERSFGFSQVSLVRHSGVSQKNPNSSLGTPAWNVRLLRTAFLRPFECCTNESCRAIRAGLCHYRCTFTALKQTNPFASVGSNATEELDGIQCPFTDVTTNVSAQ